MLLAWIFPTVIVGLGAGGLAAGFWALKRWAEGGGLEDADVREDELDDADAGEREDRPPDDQPKPKPSGKCSRTGEMYDAYRWASPAHVAAALVALGYPVGPTLVTKADKAQVKVFQADAIKLGLHGLKGASTKWVDGDMGPCTLLALSQAETLLKAGKWIPRQEPNWFEKMLQQAAEGGG